MEYDESLKYTGEFGSYQKKTLFILCLVAFPTAFQNLGYVFWAVRPAHWCKIDKPRQLNNLTDETWKNLTIPLVEVDGEWVYSECEQYDINITSLRSEADVGLILKQRQSSSDAPSTRPCTDWEYDRSEFTSTIVTEFNIVCGRRWFRSSSQSAYMSGKVVGALLFGAFADKFGRRTVLLVAAASQAVVGCAIAFAPEIYSFLALRFATAIVTTGVFQVGYVLALEIVGPSIREFANTMLMICWALAYMMLSVLAYFLRDRFYLQLATSAPALLLLPLYWFVPESPRWLLLKGREEEAHNILNKMTRHDKEKLTVYPGVKLLTEAQTHKRVSWKTALGKPFLWIMSIVLCLVWFSNNMVYYGLSFAASSYGGNIFVSNFISGAVEIPAYILALFAHKKLGRQKPLLVLLSLAGVSLLVACFLPTDMKKVIRLLAMTGKFAITCTFSMAHLYTSELYPTSIRTLGLGLCNGVSRIGATIAPIVAELEEIKSGSSMVLFGVLAIITGLAVVLLPETKGKKLPQTLQQGSDLARSSPVYCCFKKNPSTLSLDEPPAHCTEPGSFETESTSQSDVQRSEICESDTTPC